MKIPLLVTVIIAVLGFCAPAFADPTELTKPEDFQIVEGAGTFALNGNTLTANISTATFIANVNGLNVPEGYTFQINQPTITSWALFRDIGNIASTINGIINATANVALVNPNGFNIGSNAQITAANLIVSTLNIANQDFINFAEGRVSQLKFFGQGSYIISQGKLIPKPGGYACLLSQAIDNSGTIQAALGRIALASGEAITLSLDDAGTISVVVDEAVKNIVLGPNGNKMASGIKNSGTISADGGTVTLTAKVLNKVFDYAINNAGIIQANALSGRGGRIELVAEGASILNSGNIYADIINILVKDGDFINTASGEVKDCGSANSAVNIAAVALVQDGLISASYIEVNADKVETTTPFLYDPDVLSGDPLNPDLPAAVIQAKEVRVSVRKLGSGDYPINIDADIIRINIVEGDINIMDSVGIGTSILMRGPPDSSFSIIYSKDSNLILDAARIELVGSRPISFYGNITFSNLYCTVPGKTIYFEAGKTYTITGTTHLEGAVAADGSINYIRLLSSEKNVPWYINPQGSHEISYVYAEDSYNMDPRLICGTSINHDGDSYNWDADRYWVGGAGNWNDAAHWAATSNGTGGESVPGAADDAFFDTNSDSGSSFTVTVTADGEVGSITFSTTSTPVTLSVNSGITLTVTTASGRSGAIILQNTADTDTSATLSGAGTINCASVTVGGTTTALTSDATTTLTSTISTLSISGDLNINGEDDGSDDNNATFALASGSVSVGGTVNADEENGSSVTLTLNTGAETGTLILAGATPFTNLVGSLTFDANGTDATVNYSRAGDQTVKAVTYRNLTLSGSGTKTLTGLATVNGNLTMAGTATATTASNLTIGGSLDIGSGTTLTVAGFNFSVTGTTSISGTLTVSGTAGTKTFDDIVINNGGLFNSTVNESYSLTGNLQVDGTGSIVSGTGAWTFSGAGTLSGTGSATITNADFTTSYSNSGTFTFVDLHVQGGGTVNLTNNGTITVTNTLTGNDNFVQGATGVLNFNGSSIGITGFNASAAGNTVNYTGASQTVEAATYHILNFSGSGTKTLGGIVTVNDDLTIGSGTTLDVSGSNYSLTVNGDWANNGAFDGRAGTVTFNGTSTQSIGGSSATAFRNLAISNANGAILNSDVSYSGTLTLTNGAKFKITVTAVTDTRTYDGTTNSSGTPTITSGRLLTNDTATWTQTFDNRNAGTTKTLTPAGTVTDGNGGANYNVTFTNNTTGVINKRDITVTAATDTKTYDGDTTSAGTPTITSGTLVGGDTATWTQTFDNKNAGAGKTLTPAGTVTDGNGGANYNVTFTNNTTGVINQRTLTVGATGVNKVYDGTTAATVTLADNRLAGDILTDNYTSAAFVDSGVGVGKTVNVTGISITGADSGNYVLSSTTAITTADISAAPAATINPALANANNIIDNETLAALAAMGNPNLQSSYTSMPIVYFYHAISYVDSSAFDGIYLDAGAYEFIEGILSLREEPSAYYGLQEYWRLRQQGEEGQRREDHAPLSVEQQSQ